MTQPLPDESQYVDEMEQLVPFGQTVNCIPSTAVDGANDSRPGAGTELVISGNNKSVVSRMNLSAHPMQNENATIQPSSMDTLPENGLDNSIGQNISIQPSSIHAPPGSSLQNVIGQNHPVQPSSTNMLSYTAPPGTSGLHNSIGQNQSVQPSSIHMPSHIAPPGSSGFQNSIRQKPIPTHMLSYMTAQEGSGVQNSISENQSVQPSSINMPSHIAPAEGSNQQQIGQNQVTTTHRQPEAGRSQIHNHQQSRNINKEEDNPSSSQQSHSQGSADLIRRTGGNCTSLQHSDNPGNKKVFILHSIPEKDHRSGALLSFAVALRDFGINVSIDLFEQDKTHDNWSMWYEREILSSKVVLCVITPNFYESITKHDRIKGYAIYNLMGDSTKDIAFRAVFLDTQKNMEDIPLSMRGATCYCISSNDLNVPDNDEFTNLYAFLTGQNRVEKPKLGKVVKLAPKKSRFGQARGQHAPINRDQQRYPINAPQRSAPISDHRNEQAKLMFDLLSKDTTQVKSLRSHQRMFATLATNMTAKWEVLARMLEIGENNVFAIKSDHRESVQEQAVQMFQKWLECNGSAATLGVLTRAVYESGPPYYNLLDIVNKYAPK